MEQSVKWHRAAVLAEIEDDDVVGVIVGEHDEHEVAIYKLAGKCYATANRCTHQEAKLSDGLVIDDFIECPLHQGRFHIPTGKALTAPVSVRLQTYPTKVEGGVVYVQIDDIQFD